MNGMQSMFRERLGLTLPIVQAPMAGVQGSALAVARPFNVNFFCHPEPAPSPTGEAAWRDVLAPYYAEFDIDPRTIKDILGRPPSTPRPPICWPNSSPPSSAFTSDSRRPA
jgi:nitronate monooxygenase